VIKKRVLFISFFLLCSISYSQKTNSKIPIIDVLKTLEKTYTVSFSYADSLVKNLLITEPNYQENIKTILNFIETNNPLIFVRISASSYAIKPSNDLVSIKTTQVLDKVVVNSYLTKGVTLNNDGSNTITSKSFGILPGLINPDILQTIQALPGITSADERISDLNIRGGTNDQNLILWEGIKMYQTGHFFGLISAFNPYITKQVNVFKNGTSAIYGDSVSSVINIENSPEISNTYSIGFGTNLLNIEGHGIIPLTNTLELQLSARRSITDFWTTPTYNAYYNRVFQDTDLTANNSATSKNDTFYFYDISTKLIYKISKKDQLSFSAISIVNDLTHQESDFQSITTKKLNSTLKQNSLAATLKYKRTWNSNLQTNVQAYISNYQLDATNFDITNDQKLVQKNEVLDLGIKFHLNYTFNKNISYSGGYQLSEIGITNLEDVNNPVFRSSIKKVNKNYFEKISKFNAEPRLSFSHKLLKNFRLETLGEVKSQITSQIIDLPNDFLGVEKRRWVLANNSTIPLIKSWQISTGIHYNKNNWLVSLEAYLKDVKNISTRSQGFQNQFQFTNTTGKYFIKGIDLLVNKKINKINTWLSYSYSENNYTFKTLNNGNSFPNNRAIKHAITLAGNYDWKKLKFGLGLNWRSGIPYTKPQNETPISGASINYENPNSSNLPDYLRLDFSTNYVFLINKTIKATTGFSLWNITNAKNILNRYYLINNINEVNETENQSLGITPNINLRIDF